MTWQTFKKKFNPKMYGRADSVFGTISTIDSTMQDQGFKSMTILDIDEEYNYKPPKPIDIVKDKVDVYKYSYVVYYVWRHRDFTGKGLDIYYR